MIDEKFDAIYEDYENDDEASDLSASDEDEEDDGHKAASAGLYDQNSEHFQTLVAEERERLKARRIHLGKPEEEVKQRILKAVGDGEREENGREEKREKLVVGEKRNGEKWDCESILSTYSTLYNHPTLICNKGKTSKRRRTTTKGDGAETDEVRKQTPEIWA